MDEFRPPDAQKPHSLNAVLHSDPKIPALEEPSV